MKIDLMNPSVSFIIILSLFLSLSLIGQTYGDENLIFQCNDLCYPRALTTADVNGDGYQDVIVGYDHIDLIAWYENLGNGSFSDGNTISVEVDWTSDLVPLDMDNDGDVDIISSNTWNSVIYSHENMGNGTFLPKKTISNDLDGSNDLELVDFDGDGDMDLLISASIDNRLYWIENYSNGSFGEAQVLATGINRSRATHAADLDDDGDMDVVALAFWPQEKVSWIENLGNKEFSSPKTLSSRETNTLLVTATMDYDNDGDLDILTADIVELAMYENLGNGEFSSKIVVLDDFKSIQDISIFDFDLDGDEDLVLASSHSDALVLMENLGDGKYAEAVEFKEELGQVEIAEPFDVDNDGDMDIIAAVREDDMVVWFENTLLSDVDEIFSDDLAIYPNPASEFFNLEGDVQRWSLYNLQGQAIMSNQVGQGDVSHLSTGIYLVKAYSQDDNLVGISKLFIE